MRLDWMVVLAQTLVAVVMLTLVVMTVRLSGTVREQWENTADLASREMLLGGINRNLGYGGMIHSLKNYVLRGDQEYIAQFDETHTRAVELLDAYAMLPKLNDVERRSLNEVRRTVAEYRGMMDLAVASELGIAETDLMVRVDDAPAMQALQEWSDYLNSQTQQVSRSEIARMGLASIVAGWVAVIALGGGAVTLIIVRLSRRELTTLASAKQEVELASKAMTDFLANMSHEIRTPMTSIVGYSSMIAEEAGPALAVYTESIQRNARHLMSIVDDLLDIAVIESGKLELREDVISPRRIAEDVRSMLTEQARAKGLELRIRSDARLPNAVYADGRRLRQILLNIAGNAVKFTDQGSVSIELSYKPGPEPTEAGEFTMSVRDTGRGMPKEIVERLFRRFEQEDTSSTRLHGGIGLGLAISRALVDEMGGRIEVQTKLGSGSVFEVHVPMRAEVMSSEDEETEVITFAGLPKPDTAPRGQLAGMRILLVEDGDDNRRLVHHFLSRAGALVDFAENGRDAINMITRAEPYHLILMDMQMPIMDGVEATSRLRSDGYGQPILGLTAHAMESDRVRFIEAGCNAVLTKPVARQALVEEVSRLATSVA